MSQENTSDSPEMIALNNVINKLQVYMDRNNQTLHGLASTMGFAYQPFYRLVTKKHLPTISSLGLIATHLNCSIAELTHENIFLDICSYENILDDLTAENNSKYRIYIPYEEYIKHLRSHFFALKCQKVQYGKVDKEVYLDELFQLFFSTDDFFMDGIYLVQYHGEKVLMNVLSISSKFVVIEENNQEVKIDIESLKVIAKLFSYLEIIDRKIPKVFGTKR